MSTMRHILTLIIVLTAMQAHAQLTAAKCFVDAPDEVMPMLPRNTRLDMLDYYRAGSDRHSTNIFEGDSRILAIDSVDGSSSVVFESGTGLRGQIFVLNADSAEPLIGVVETVDTPLPDSSLRIYDKTWQCIGSLLALPNATVAVPSPKLADWLKHSSDRSAVAESLPFVMATYEYVPSRRALVLKHSMEGYFEKTEGDKVLSKIKPQLTYVWDGKQFKPSKK